MTTPTQPSKDSFATCEQAQDIIFNLQEAALVSAKEQTFLDSHLSQCVACQTYQQDLATLTTAMGEIDAVEVPAELASRIMTRIAEAKPVTAQEAGLSSQRFLRHKYTPIAAAVLILAIAVPLLIPQSPMSLTRSTESALQADANPAEGFDARAIEKNATPEAGHSELIDGTQLAQGGGGLNIGLKQTYASETEGDMYYDPVSTLVGF